MAKKDIARQAAGLRRAGKADLPAQATPQEQLRELQQEARNQALPTDCAMCAKNDGGLCPEHLAQALGF